ncbi:MAG: LytTR family DNA-binding domain-containing protein [Bacteroidia bacterium]|nr:LytTR family DNA-binding domain-containing protein [Bacteroidia bacterium]MDW8159777.1 LytTR family DNA-binding domain-containing protein [Bacteroidia bacterium]
MTKNSQIRCIIIDDDEISRTIIEKYIEKTEILELVGSYESAEEGLAPILNHEADLIFLDIEMPQMTGIELIKSLIVKPYIVLITAQKEYALEAFDLDVTDYLLKPFDYPRFLKAVGKVKELIDIEAQAKNKSDIFVKHQSRYIKIPTHELLWIEAIGDYVELHTAHKKYIVHTTMKAIEKKLPANEFLRVHRSYIVRLDAISEIEDNTLVIEKKLIPIGKSYRNQLMKNLNLL